jgi:hypothetical protein
MSSPSRIVVLWHGTTLRRAERLLIVPPEPLYVEPKGKIDNRARGFSTAIQGAPDIGLGTPEAYARSKAVNFPDEGGPVILEVEVPGWIVDIIFDDPELGLGALSGDIRFEPGVGLEELIRSWPTLAKRIVRL